jgi:glycosyltransferase involved in cell wall biosynthesis
MKSVTAIIPYYNASDTLSRALTSIYGQTVPVLEVIVVDDASNAEESSAGQEIAKQFPSVRYIRLDVNGGPSIARNRGVYESLGEYVAFLDSDDYWLPSKLEICLAKMDKHGADFIGHNNLVAGERHHSISDRLRPISSEYYMREIDLYLSTSQFAPSTVVFCKDRVAAIFDERIRRSEDYRLWGDLIFGGVRLWKTKDFLSVREEPHIKGSGLSGNVSKLLESHLETLDYFYHKKYYSKITNFLAKKFLIFKYLRHR